MALIKYGGGIVQMSGSIAGNTHARNRFGNYMRARTKPVNPKSPRQVAARVNMMFLAEQWREAPMTPAIRAAWETYAASVNWNNKLGESVSLTGFNMFMRANSVLLTAGQPIVTAGPTDLGLPAGDPLMVADTLSEAANTYSLTFDDTMEWCDENGAHAIIEAGQPQNPTRNFFNGPWRFTNRLSGSVGVPPVSPSVGTALNGWEAIEGQRIWFRFSIIRADGRVTTKFGNAYTTVVA